MAEEKKEEKKIEVSEKLLLAMQEKMASLEREIEDGKLKQEGLAEMVEASSKGDEPKLREKKTFEPKFRTVRLRKYPIAGDETNLGYVIGWSKRGAYQQVDRSGPTPLWVDMIDIMFLGAKNFETVKLLDYLNKGVQVHCKILKQEKTDVKVPTGEELSVTTWDPQHGLIDTGDKVDGFFTQSEITLTIEVPGLKEPLVIDQLYVNN